MAKIIIFSFYCIFFGGKHGLNLVGSLHRFKWYQTEFEFGRLNHEDTVSSSNSRNRCEFAVTAVQRPFLFNWIWITLRVLLKCRKNSDSMFTAIAPHTVTIFKFVIWIHVKIVFDNTKGERFDRFWRCYGISSQIYLLIENKCSVWVSKTRVSRGNYTETECFQRNVHSLSRKQKSILFTVL